MGKRKYQTTDDVIARAASGGFTPARPSGWVIAACIIGGLVIVAGLLLAFA